MAKQSGLVICVISPNRQAYAYSESFIRAHVERLPARVELLYGGFFPLYRENGNRALFPRWLKIVQIARHGIRRLSNGLNTEGRIREAALTRFLKAEGVSVVLAEYGPTGASVIDACQNAGVPLVVHFHGYDAYDHRTLEEYGLSYQRMFAAAGAIIAGARDMERHLLSLGVAREKLFYNPCGVDTTLFSGGEPSSVTPIFSAVGRFVDKKAPHLTLLAFNRVAKVCPEARLLMIGEGQLLEACKQIARALGLCDKVKFLGVRFHPEIVATMRTSRAFVQHSVTTTYGDSEGTSLTVLEAGAVGLPVVATRHGGIKDSVLDGATGFLVDEGDVEGMATHMIQLAQDPILAGRMGKAGRQRIMEQFSMETSIDGLWTIITNCAGLSRNGNE